MENGDIPKTTYHLSQFTVQKDKQEMERYTQFRDKASGISPFLPITQTNVIGVSDSPIQSFIKSSRIDLIPKTILVLTKVALIAPLFVAYIVLSAVVGPTRVSILLGAIVFVAGLTSYEISIQNIKSKSLKNREFYPSKNQIYFVNFSSPLDVILLALISNDDFVLLFPDSNGQLIQLSTFQLILKSLSGYEPIKAPSSKLSLKNYENKIVYIFAEGTTSNGKAILPFLLKQSSFDEFLSTSESPKYIKSVGIKVYPSTLVTPLKYSLIPYFFKTLTSLLLTAKLRINVVNELNPSESSLIKIRQSFTNNGKFKLVNDDLNVDAKQNFIKSYIGRK